jgi:ATP-binding cassette subfamily C protein
MEIVRRGGRSSSDAAQRRDAIRHCRAAFVGIGVFSGLINMLALTGSFYMLQVYDRVLTSRSVPTLVGLTVLMVVPYAIFGLLDVIRSRVMGRTGRASTASCASA